MAPAPSKNASTKSKPHGRKRSAEATEYAVAADDDTFEVEDVIGRRFNRGGVEYLIRWKGYSEEHNTWEPAVNLSDAARESGNCPCMFIYICKTQRMNIAKARH